MAVPLASHLSPDDGPIERAVRAMGDGPLTEDGLRAHVWPLFSRVLQRRELYLANHSLGRPLDALADDLREFTDHWYADMDGAWGPWMQEQAAYRARVARLIGCARADAVVPKAAAGQGLRAVLNALAPERPRVVATRGEFDAIDFVLKAYHERGRADVRWVEQREGSHARDGAGGESGLPLIDAADVIAAVTRGCDVLVVSHVFYATGQLLQGLPQIISAAHRAGALVVLDTYHSAGVMPVGFDDLGPDFAIGGNYKYTRGGPGAGWLAVHPRHLADADGRTPANHPLLRPTLDTGWFAKRDTFGFQRPEHPLREPGGDAWLENTPAAAVWYQARSGLRLTLALGVERLRAYSLQQQAFLVERLRERGVPVRDLSPRGAYVLIPARDHVTGGEAAVAALKARGVNTDARLGHVRLCPDILNTRDEMARAAEIVAGVLAEHTSPTAVSPAPTAAAAALSAPRS